MTKQAKKIYRVLAWLLAVVLASGTLVGCRRTKYGPPTPKYGPSPSSGYQDNNKGNNVS